MLIVMDGPEKAGKTTMLKEFCARTGSTYRHWGPVSHDSDFLSWLKEDTLAVINNGADIVWDRSWASEAIYATLLDRDRRLRHDYWLGEWLYSRAVWAIGFCAALLGPSPDILTARRTPDDLPCDPFKEQEAYRRYTTEALWKRVTCLDDLLEQYDARKHQPIYVPPGFSGRVNSPVVMVSAGHESLHAVGGEWLSLSSPEGRSFPRLLGRRSLAFAWTNAETMPNSFMRDGYLVIALGQLAGRILWNRGCTDFVRLPSAISIMGMSPAARETLITLLCGGKH